jgi:PAS domain S-box-containing protein
MAVMASGSEPSREALVAEIAELRRRVMELESADRCRRQVETDLRASEAQFRALIDATGEDIVLLLDSQFRALIVNERTARGFGLRPEEMVGHSLDEIAPGPVAERRREMALKVLSEGRSVRFEDERAGHWFDNNMCPVTGPDGKPQGVAVFARDITERKGIEQALSAAKEAAERANHAKSRFLAAANHDLRQPLQAMSMLIEALSYQGLNKHSRDILGDMRNTLAVMGTLLNALLDISKLDAGVIVPCPTTLAAVPFLERLRVQFRPLAADRGVRIRLFPRNVLIETDPALLERILHNLTSNAIRHTRRGRILIGCRIRNRYLRIEVWDAGEGIPVDALPRIFDEFYQVGHPARTRDQGLGLGLAIAKRLADLLGLRIGARSREGRGSMFFVEVPLALTRAPHPVRDTLAPEPATGAADTLVLLVEDDERVMSATARLLRLWGFRTLCAASAEAALMRLAESASTPDVALIDYRLPEGRTGVDLLAEIRQRFGLYLPAVLITGDTAAQRLRAVKASGYPVLHKPVAPEELRRALLEQCRTGPPP